MGNTTVTYRIAKLHQPSLNRVPVPGIFQDAPACRECGKAWPCTTYEITQGADS